jgi:uncharacterized protein (UPF0371 family)
MVAMQAFNTELYRILQLEAFRDRIPYGEPTLVEFGGKPFGDYHASRVLPGYDPDVKAGIIRDVYSELSSRALGGAVITIAVHAKDILLPPDGRRPGARIRGDYGITYDQEVLRMTDEARSLHNIPISNVAITSLPGQLSHQNAELLGVFKQALKQDFDVVRTLPEIDRYPDIHPGKVVGELTKADPISSAKTSELVVSPGGGSGKFSVAVTGIAHKLLSGLNPHYIKFETFPVFHLPVNHPLNIAFLAATVDLGNELVLLENGETNYDKDVGNFRLLKTLLSQFPSTPSPMNDFELPTDMGVNVIEKGIVNHDAVARACNAEVARRRARYEGEVASGYENPSILSRMTVIGR